MVNLSSKPLSQDMVNLLSKGLGYAPVPALPDRSNLSENLLALARCLRIAYHFRNSRQPGNKHPFKPKSQWIPPKANKMLEDYIEATILLLCRWIGLEVRCNFLFLITRSLFLPNSCRILVSFLERLGLGVLSSGSSATART